MQINDSDQDTVSGDHQSDPINERRLDSGEEDEEDSMDDLDSQSQSSSDYSAPKVTEERLAEIDKW